MTEPIRLLATVISPSVGRVVHYWPKGMRNEAQPLAAIIVYVHDVRMVNLAVFNRDGTTFNSTSVVLAQPDDPRPDSAHCSWMPYQIGQSVKMKAPSKEFVEMLVAGGEPHDMSGGDGPGIFVSAGQPADEGSSQEEDHREA